MPTHLLGSRKKPADTAAIAKWLSAASTATNPAGAVLALDTLTWGGLIPSRQSGNDLDTALERLAALRHLKERYPDMPVLAYSSIQRVSRQDNAGEEPEYYATYGRAIFRRSTLEHRQVAGVLTRDEEGELERLRAEVPAAVWEDQLAIRQRTMTVNLAALDLASEGIIDTLVLNQDDTAVWGINVMNRQRLEQEVSARGLGDRVFIYPGADEVAQVLIARLASQVHEQRVTVGTLFSSRHGADVQTSYEDRPLGDLISVHLRAAGAVQVPPGVPPDVWLAVNSPSQAQGRGGAAHVLATSADLITVAERAQLEALEAPVAGLDRSLETFRDTLSVLFNENQRVSLADVAHANGADDVLLSGLAADGALPRLSGYGGWNTAGNSLGSAVALGCIAALNANHRALELAVAARFVDDWLYQSRVRARLLLKPELKSLGYAGFVPAADLAAVSEQARAWLNEDLCRFKLPFSVTRLALPWQRLFEIDYDLERTDGD